MKRNSALLLAGLLSLLAACVPSVNPLYTPKDVVFDPALVGAWGDSATSKEVWTFEKEGADHYRLLQRDEEGRVARFDVHLLEIKGMRFLDLHLVDAGPTAEWRANTAAAAATILRPAHLFACVRQIEPRLRMTFLSSDWIEGYLKDHPKELAHEIGWNPDASSKERRVILTATTRDLQRFLLTHLDAAFPEDKDGGMIRVTPGGKP